MELETKIYTVKWCIFNPVYTAFRKSSIQIRENKNSLRSSLIPKDYKNVYYIIKKFPFIIIVDGKKRVDRMLVRVNKQIGWSKK